MKKLMTATMILLPLIVLAILLVSGAILSMITHIYVESIEFSESDTIVLIMQDASAPPTYELGPDVTILPLKASNREVEFTSDDETLASVNENGLITAKFWGETVITVSSRENTAARAQRKVLITDTHVHALIMDEGYNKDMYEGETQVLSVGVFPKEALNKGVTWTSSDESILRVSSDGTVTAAGEGTATVTATSADNGEVTATAEITCHKRLVDITIDRSLVVTSKKTQKFPEVIKAPVDAGASLTYASSDEAVATVDGEGNITFLKPGHVTISVTATDFGGRSVTRTKEYTSTYGYYMPKLFAQASYTVDFDEYEIGAPLPITMTKAPDGADRQINGVYFSPENVIEFDEETLTFSFVGEMPVGARAVQVTVDATVYDAETNALNDEYQDFFTINVTRKATGLLVSYGGQAVETIQAERSEFVFSDTATGPNVISVTATPANHTDDISYTLVEGEEEVVSLTGATLKFKVAGTAKVKISASETVYKEVTIGYTPTQPGTKNISFEGESRETSVSLRMMSAETKDEGVILFNTPEGATVTYSLDEAGKEVIDLVAPEDATGNYKIVPKKGGFATVTIKVEYASPVAAIMALNGDGAAGETAEYTIKIYVNKAVSSDDFTVTIGGKTVTDKLTTSLTEIGYDVTAVDREGALAGKEIWVTVGGGEAEKVDDLHKTGTLSFAGAADTLTVKIETRFSADVPEDIAGTQDPALVTLTRSVMTTRGKLTALPVVTCGETVLTEGEEADNEIVFDDLDYQKTITVMGPFTPDDFVLTDHKPVISGDDFVRATVKADGTVTLTALRMTVGTTLTMTVGGYTYKIAAVVHSHADTITVSLGDTELSAGADYKTLLDSLAFEIELSRADGKSFDETEIEYSANGNGYATATKGEDGKYKISWAELSTLYFQTADGYASLTLNIEKVTLDDFGVELFYTKTGGGSTSLLTVGSVKEKNAVECVLPADMQNTLKIKIGVDGDFLGGLGTDEQFKALFPVTTTRGVEYNAADSAINVTLPAGEISETVTVGCGAAALTLSLSRIRLGAVSFGSNFDMSVDNNVHAGYQQVRVFAKHSYYGGSKVDYFDMPLAAYTDHEGGEAANAGILTWRLYGVKENEKTLMTYQKGRSVTAYDGDKQYDYEIEAEGNTLQRAAGNTDGNPDSVAWVDVFTKEGSALIRFGSFTGLSETDVANDYFGNFDERDGYTPTPQREEDGSGRDFVPSPGAYTFMRVEAGDGAASGVNRHFNFNVLAGSDLVNVFDATGYYANEKIVLHENLYGDGELGTEGPEFDKATEKGLFLTKTNTPWNSTDSTVLGKTTVYGNGYQINLQAKNEALKTAKPEEKNNSWGVSFGNLYNVFVKGANPEETVNVLRQKIVLIFTNAYYCDLQGYTKGRPQNNQTAYIKNTVLHSASQSAFQLFYTGEKAYLENVTVVECAAGITNEQRASEVGADHETNFYFKGNIDVLNYTNVRGVTNMAAGAVSDQSLGMLSGALTSVNDHFEWFGFNCTSDQFNTYNMPYFNLVIYTSNRKGVFNFWNGTSYVKSEDDISYKCSNCGAISPNNAFCEVCFRGKMEPAFNYSYGAPEGGAPMKMVLDLSDYKSYLDGGEVTAWTYNYPKVGNKPVIHNGQEATYKVTVDGRLPNMSGTSFQYYRYMFTEERYIRLLCQYVNATDGGATLVKNEEHILWHMQQAYRDKSLLNGRNNDHISALRESITNKSIVWPDGTTPEQAMREYDEYQARLAAQ